jgi:iron complex outermembrane receptor protein
MAIFTRNPILFIAIFSILLFSLNMTDGASAQTNTQPAATEPPESEIIVTARRREERLQDVPVAVSVLSGEAVREAGLQRFEDLQRMIPAFQVQGSTFGNATPTFTVRSQRNSDTPITLDPSVSVYFSEVPQTRPQGLTGSMFDLQSVQVLKGPQGTLFGRNTTGGAVLLTPTPPTDRFEGYARATLGNYATTNFEVIANAPLADWAALRLGGQVNRHKGYVRNLTGGRLNNADNEAFRGSLRLRPTDALTNTLVVNYFHGDDSGPALRSRFVGPPATTLFPTFAAANTASNARDFWTVANNVPGFARIVNTSLSNITEFDAGSIRFKNILGYRRVKADINIDTDGTETDVFSNLDVNRSRQWSNEFQLLGDGFDNKLDYIVGAFWFREKATEVETAFRLRTVSNNIAAINNSSKSIFSQLTLHMPGLKALSLTAGGRYTWDRRLLVQRNVRASTYDPVTFAYTPVCALTDLSNAPLNPCRRSLSIPFKKFTYTLSADYKIADDVLAYVSHRTGYRSGGFNVRANPAILAVPFRPENVKDVEIGLKSEFQLGDRARARFNVAAYYQDYKDIQRSVGGTDPVTGAFLGTTVRNAASASIKGIEPELTLSFERVLTVNGYYSYSKGHYKSYPNVTASGIVEDLTPSPFAGAPLHSGGATVTWALPVDADKGEVKLIGNAYAQAKTYGSDNSYTVAGGVSRVGVIPHYKLFNARLQWNEILGSGLSAAAYVRNIGNEKYFASMLDTVTVGLGTGAATIGDPRTYGLELNYRW